MIKQLHGDIYIIEGPCSWKTCSMQVITNF
jgi:hypothetical protein